MGATPVSDQQFETQLSNLAYSFLQDRAPALIDYVVGFQLVDKDDDGTKGMGVFGLRIGKEMAYVPAFYMNGEVKGIDMLYSVDADIFVPLTEEWVNYFINRKTAKIGEPNGDTPSQRGVVNPRLIDLLANLPAVRGGQFAKVAAAMQHCDADFANVPAMLLPSKHTTMTLPEALAEMGPTIAAGFINELRTNTKLAAAVLEHYKPSDLISKMKDKLEVANDQNGNASAEDASKDDQNDDRPLMETKDKPVTVLDSADELGVTEAERTKLLAGERVVRDTRDTKDVSKLYEVEVGQSLVNPTEPGAYEILLADGSFATEYVFEPKTFGIGKTNNIRLVADPERKMATVFFKPDILARVQLPRAKFEETLASIGTDAKSAAIGQEGYFVNGKGISTFPCKILEKTTGVNGTVVYWVKPDYYVVESKNRSWKSTKELGTSRIQEDRNVVTDDGTAMDSRWLNSDGNKELVRGGEDRGIRVIIDKVNSDAVRNTSSTAVISEEQFRWVKIDKRQKTVSDLGTVADLYLGIGKFASELVIAKDGPEFTVRGPLGEATRLTKTAAFEHLLIDHALRADTADALLAKANHDGFKCRIRLPASMQKSAQFIDPSALDQMQSTDASGRAMTFPTEMLQRGLPPDRSDTQNQYGYLPGKEDYGQIYRRDTDTISQAGQSGQKDVLDTSVIMALLRTNDVGEKVRKFTPPLIGALDKLGRLLFLVYWQYDKFEDQFGKKDMSSFEDNLKHVFESLGEIVVFLHKRSLYDDTATLGQGAL
jgi:hypothetical protein